MQRAMRLEMLRQFNTHQGDVKLDALRKMMNAGGGQAHSALGIQNDAGMTTDIHSYTYYHDAHCHTYHMTLLSIHPIIITSFSNILTNNH